MRDINETSDAILNLYWYEDINFQSKIPGGEKEMNICEI